MTKAEWQAELESYVGELKLAKKSKQYVGDVNRYLPHLAKQSGVGSFKDLTRAHVIAWLGELQENGIGKPSPSGKQGLGPAKLVSVLGQLKTFVRSLNDGDFPPCVKNLPRIKVGNGSKVKSPSELLTEKDIELLGDALKQPWKAAFLVLAGTGARPAEVLKLQTNDVSEGKLDEQGVRRDLTFRDTKTGEPRTVWVYGRAREALEEALRLAGGRTYLFANRQGGPARGDSYSNALKRTARKLGFTKKVYPYLTRHSWITAMKNKGANDDSIMAMTGHATRAMLDNYSHLTQEERLKKIAPFLSPKGPEDVLEQEVQRRVASLRKSIKSEVLDEVVTMLSEQRVDEVIESGKTAEQMIQTHVRKARSDALATAKPKKVD